MSSNIRERNILIVPIGLEVSRVIEGCKSYPVNVIYLLYNPSKGNEKYAVEQFSHQFANLVKTKIRTSFNLIEEEKVNLGRFYESFGKLQEIYQKEQKTGLLNNIYINISTASKVFATAASLFASLHSENCIIFYLKTNNYVLLEYLAKKGKSKGELETKFKETGLTKGPFTIEEIPILPVTWFKDEEAKVLQVIAQHPKYESLQDLIKELGMDDTPKERIALRRKLDDFETSGLIQTVKRKKQLEIRRRAKLENLRPLFQYI